jgi:hypothetical protein
LQLFANKGIPLFFKNHLLQFDTLLSFILFIKTIGLLNDGRAEQKIVSCIQFLLNSDMAKSKYDELVGGVLSPLQASLNGQYLYPLHDNEWIPGFFSEKAAYGYIVNQGLIPWGRIIHAHIYTSNRHPTAFKDGPRGNYEAGMRLYRLMSMGIGRKKFAVIGMPDHPDQSFRGKVVFTISAHKGKYYLFPEDYLLSKKENPRWGLFQNSRSRPWFAIDYYSPLYPHRSFF